MLDVYLITLTLAVGIGLLATVGLLLVSRTVRFSGLFHGRGIQERPRWGGIAIFLGLALTPFIAATFSEDASRLFSPKSTDFVQFLLACALVSAVGFIDDIFLLSWRPKLLSHVAAASAVYAAGYSIDTIGLPWGPQLELGYLAPVLTVLWIVFFTNAINLIDGRDGVSAGVAILAAVTLAQIAANTEHPTVALLLVALAGAGLGMLPFNLPPASVYVGDSGAYLLGFVLGALSIRAATGTSDAVFVAVPIVALGFPILDTVLAAVRRMLDHRHPFRGDEDHIHHRLEVAGFGPRGLLLVIYLVAVLFSAGALALHYVHHFALETMVLLATLLLVSVILTKLGYVLSLWNSASMLWLRRRLNWIDEPLTDSD
jgi:UDP-GlcNAc:undecaprenyl-phosphate/decaprenyl-phosphate GlcNAc-1-phosphate transferase